MSGFWLIDKYGMSGIWLLPKINFTSCSAIQEVDSTNQEIASVSVCKKKWYERFSVWPRKQDGRKLGMERWLERIWSRLGYSCIVFLLQLGQNVAPINLKLVNIDWVLFPRVQNVSLRGVLNMGRLGLITIYRLYKFVVDFSPFAWSNRNQMWPNKFIRYGFW